MDYTYFEKENVPEILTFKSKWTSCLVITSGFLIMTISAITIGAIFGYTYCYIETRCRKSGNSQTVYQVAVPYPDSKEARYNRTLNGAIMSSAFVSRLRKIGCKLFKDPLSCVTGSHGNGTVSP